MLAEATRHRGREIGIAFLATASMVGGIALNAFKASAAKADTPNRPAGLVVDDFSIPELPSLSIASAKDSTGQVQSTSFKVFKSSIKGCQKTGELDLGANIKTDRRFLPEVLFTSKTYPVDHEAEKAPVDYIWKLRNRAVCAVRAVLYNEKVVFPKLTKEDISKGRFKDKLGVGRKAVKSIALYTKEK